MSELDRQRDVVKMCSKCRTHKSLQDFHRNSSHADGFNSICKMCMKEYLIVYNSINRTKINTRQMDYYTRNVDKIKEYRKKYLIKNKQKIKEYKKKTYEANKDRIRSVIQAWRLNNPDKCIEMYRTSNRRRRARKSGAVGKHTNKETIVLLEVQNFMCANPYCKADLNTISKHLDHKEPLSKGGCDCIFNLQWLCQPCNDSKGTLNWVEWLETQHV